MRVVLQEYEAGKHAEHDEIGREEQKAKDDGAEDEPGQEAHPGVFGRVIGVVIDGDAARDRLALAVHFDGFGM